MKRIIALILALAALTMLFSCGSGDDDVVIRDTDFGTDNEKLQAAAERVGEALIAFAGMYQNSAPTKTVVTTLQKYGDDTFTHEFRGEYDLTVGQLATGKKATIYSYWYERLADIEDYSTNGIKKESGSLEYVEGKGLRTNKGNWNVRGKDFAPARGMIALDLTEVTEFSFKNHVATFTLPAAAVKTAFGDDTLTIGSNVSVTVTEAGGNIISADLTYTVPAIGDFAATAVTVHAVYTYDLELISL